MKIRQLCAILSLGVLCYLSPTTGFANDATKLAPEGWRKRFSSLTFLEEKSIPLEDLLIAGKCNEAKSLLETFTRITAKSFWLSRMYEVGVCVEIDKELALKTLIDLSKYSSHFDYRIGLFYEFGIGTAKDPQLAELYFKKDLYGSEPLALITSQKIHTKLAEEKTIDLPPSKIYPKILIEFQNIRPHTAKTYFDIAERLASEPLTYETSELWYMAAADIGHAKAKMEIIRRKLEGRLSIHNPYTLQQAIKDLGKMAQANHFPALLFAAKIQMKSPLIKRNEKSAISHLALASIINSDFDFQTYGHDIGISKSPLTEAINFASKHIPPILFHVDYQLNCPSSFTEVTEAEIQCISNFLESNSTH